jgi:flavorubredoxin
MHTEFGTSYNAYLIKGSEKTALVESVKARFFDEYLENIEHITPVSQIDYIIVNHTEPDHAGCIGRLLDLNGNITIVGSMGAVGFLKKIVNKDFKSIIVKENDTLSLGNKTLRFMILPNLHWPDTMYTYIPEDKTLFTCDSFGAHYAHDSILRSTVENESEYLGAAKYYFDCIISPFRQPYMTAALDRIRDLDTDLICTGHGPVLDSHITQIKTLYAEWCKKEVNEKPTVVIAYVSAYGYTKMLADAIIEGITESGVDAKLYNLENSDYGAVLSEIEKADGFLLGSPTLLGDAVAPVYILMTSMYKAVYKGKLASAFGSYGWSGEAVNNIIERQKQIKLNTVEGFKVRFMPNSDELNAARDFGRVFAATVIKQPNVQ